MMRLIFRKKEAPFFSKELPQEGRNLLKNPGGGWYRIYTLLADTDIVDKELIWSLHEEDVLVFLLIDIGMYQKEKISQEGLRIIRHILSFFEEHGKEMILRFVYDREGRGMLKEPPYFDLVREHMRQIGEIVAEYASSIYTMQGIFVGNWGEMHGSKFLAKEQVKLLTETLWESCGKSIPMAVRKPAHWRMIFPEKEGEHILQVAKDPRASDRAAMRVGLYDDAILSSDDDMGTFGIKPRRESAWTDSWLPEDELRFLMGLGGHFPIGGETAKTASGVKERSFDEIIAVLRRMRISYLNCVHDASVLTKWKKIFCEQEGVWLGISLYDYVGVHLAYRFVIREAEIKKQKKKGKVRYVLCLTIENTGFSRCFEKGVLSLLLKEDRAKQSNIKACNTEIVRHIDIRNWESGQLTKITHEIQEISGEGILYLCLRRKKDNRTIYFANQGNQGNQAEIILGRFSTETSPSS